MLEKGKKISEYALVEKIGRGGFGDVWLAEKRTQLSVSQFALKFFRPAETSEFEVRTVQTEVEVWQKISGLPNVISVIEADFYEDYIYIVSEYADGGSLQKWLAVNGGKAPTTAEAVTITLEILNGLDYLHRAGFIHRDIKPANILIRKGTFCLADFGITREIKTHSVTLHTAGTYNYMPPEAFNKTPTVSPATDIWAVAVIFQELLTGKLPFSQTEIPSLMYSILHNAPDEMPDAIPPTLKAIVRTALHKQREDRYSTARQMIDELKNFQSANTGKIESSATKEITETPPLKIAADTILDESFVAPNYITDGDERETILPRAKRTLEPAEEPSSLRTRVVPASRKTKRNNLFVVGSAAVLICVLGTLFIAARFFSTSAREFFERGLECAKQQNHQCAIDEYGKAIEVEPSFADAYKHRAATFYANGDFQKSIPDYNRAVELAPNDAGVFYGRATALSNSGDYDGAIRDYTKAIELNPQDAKYVFSRGLVFYNRKEYEKAIADYDRAIELDSGYAEAFNNRGNVFDEQGKNKQAIDDYTKAVELDPNFALAYSNRGTSHARQGNYTRAVEDLNRALEIKPDLASAYFNRANIFYLQNEHERALTDYNRFIELNPNNSLAYGNRAAILGNRKNYTQAIEDFNRAVELNPQDAENYYNRALVYEKIGNREKARSDRQRYNDLSLKR